MEKDKKQRKLKFNKEKFTSFMNKHGFYLILFLCICIIGATAILTSDRMQLIRGKNNIALEDNTDKSGKNTDGIDISIIEGLDKKINQNKDKDDKKVEGTDSDDLQEGKGKEDKNTDTETQDDSKSTDKTPKDEDKDTDGDKAENKDTEQTDNKGDKDNDATPASSSKVVKDMIMPVDGEIIKQFSMEELVYSKTINSWSTHTGIDIAGKLGAEVKAAKKGIVESIDEDALMGIIITLDHGDGVKTVYKGLSSKDVVTEGQEVEQGQTISGIGDTATLEILDDPHLHFEVLVDGKLVNPLNFIK